MRKQQFTELLIVFTTLTLTIIVMALIPWAEPAQANSDSRLINLDAFTAFPFEITDTSLTPTFVEHPDSVYKAPGQKLDSAGTLKSQPSPRIERELSEFVEVDPLDIIQILKPEIRKTYPRCQTPRSLMLHTHFGLQNMRALAEAIDEHDLQTITYRETWELMRAGECPPENAIIVSLDDLSTARVNPTLQKMIETFTDRDLQLVVGVVLRTPYAPDVWEYLQELENSGVEIASHTIDHLNLPTCSDTELFHQISDSYELICSHLGRCPVSLIVPFGSMDTTGRIMHYSHQYVFVVGIAHGLEIGSSRPYYVGRISPSTTSLEATFQVLDILYHP
jgi:peptidoglycan/xylan/chitin deacetylase (PgdA/CDA1 family)